MKNRKYRVIAAALAAAAVLVTLLAQTVLAGDWKWNREKEKWWYLDDQNTYPVNGWEWIDGKCYRFDEEGYLYVDTVTPEGLTVNANGEWTVNGVVQEMETVLKENPPKQETVVVETAAETQPAATEPETGSDSETPSSGEESGSSLADKLRERLSSGGGLINIDISDVDATLRDNPIEHDILVESDFLNDNSIEHDWSVSVDNSRFNNNTFIRQYSRDSSREYNPRPAAPVDYTYSTAPKTGDANNIGLWVAVVGVSAVALAATLVILKKRKG